MHNVSGHLFTIALAAGIAACSHAQPKADGSGQQTQPQAQATEAGKNVTPEAYHAQGQADLDKALEELRAVSVFFEFDSATLTTDAKEKLSAVGDVLVKHQELKVRIEGNCDERGSEQYNLALGQRRADAAKKYLDNLGVKRQQITAISFGAERPKATGHDEEAWRQNRRDDFNAQK
ncbi:MAG: peptidoglycan-associated lipoprotein Pal [Deltaproteobacteria bacterium]|nr:MAG: peptidoglycan-associated lipoprotein Pal [Deltaproteobacteria bacterium]